MGQAETDDQHAAFAKMVAAKRSEAGVCSRILARVRTDSRTLAVPA